MFDLFTYVVANVSYLSVYLMGRPEWILMRERDTEQAREAGASTDGPRMHDTEWARAVLACAS
jgi:hypothetical protein